MHLRAIPIVYAIHRYGTRNMRDILNITIHDITDVDYIIYYQSSLFVSIFHLRYLNTAANRSISQREKFLFNGFLSLYSLFFFVRYRQTLLLMQ